MIFTDGCIFRELSRTCLKLKHESETELNILILIWIHSQFLGQILASIKVDDFTGVQMISRFFIFTFISAVILSNPITSYAAGEDAEVMHCYHWLEDRTSGRLQAKYQYAAQNNGQMLNITGSNGTNAGLGFYCAQSPISTRSYGDRVIRIDFVDDVVIRDDVQRTGNHCPGGVRTKEECDNSQPDVILYPYNVTAYVVKNLNAIKFWSANSDQLISDIRAATKSEEPLIKIMKAEQLAMHNAIIENQSARMNLADLINDSSRLNKISSLRLVKMFGKYKHFDKIPESKINKLLNEKLPLALADANTTTDDIKKIAGISSDLKDKVVKVLADLIAKRKITLSTPSEADLISEKLIVTSEPSLKLFISNAFKESAETFKKVMYVVIQSKDSPLKSILLSSLNNKMNMGKFYDATKADGVQWLSQEFSEAPASTASQFGAILALSFADKDVKTADLVKGINSLDKTKTEVVDLIANLMSSGQGSERPEVMIAMASVSASRLSASTKAALSDKLIDQSLEGKSIIELGLGSLLSNLNNTKISFIDDTYVLKKVITKAFNEQNADEKSSKAVEKRANLYRYFLSEFFAAYSAYVTSSPDANLANAHISQVSVELAEWVQKTRPEYSYPFLQNASVFAAGGRYSEHPMEALLGADIKNNGKISRTLKMGLIYSLDPVVMLYLNSSSDDKLQDLLGDMLEFIASPEFAKMSKSKLFDVLNYEKGQWANFIKNPKLSQSNRFKSDLCSFKVTLENMQVKEELTVKKTIALRKLADAAPACAK